MNTAIRTPSDVQGPWREDPLQQIAHRIAVGRAHCACDYPYHVLWPILRAAGITGSLRYHEDEALSPSLSPLLSDGARVLIAGSADTGTLCVAGRLAGSRSPEFTVLDHCPAPLKLIDDFTAARNLSCRTLHADVLKFAEIARWDVVLINYTLQFITSDDRPRALANLARALVPGGTLICVAKTAGPVSRVTSAGMEKAWLDRARHKLGSAGLELPLAPDEIDALLHQAAAGRTLRRRMNPSHAELMAGLRGAGLVPIGENMTPRQKMLETGGDPATDIEPSVVLTATRPD